MAVNYLNLFKLIAWLITITLLVYYVFEFLFPFAVSLIIALMINPVVQVIQKKFHLNRKLSVLTVLFLILLCFITFISFSLVELIHLLQYLIRIMPDSIDELFIKLEQISAQTIERSYQLISSYFNSVQPQSQQFLKEIITEAVRTLKEYSQQLLIVLLNNVMSSITNVLKGSYYLLFIFISTFFISADGPKWLKTVKKSMPQAIKEKMSSMKINFIALVKKYAIAQLIIVFITGSMVLIGLTFFDVRHALAIACIAIILDLIPFIGVSALFVPWLLYLFITSSYLLTIEISILYIILIITRNIIEPKLIGSSIGIHPLMLIIVLFVFVNFFGLLGFLLGPIAVVSFRALTQSGVTQSALDYILTQSNNSEKL
ncbi:sporulation integral membrane protein YtvI [Filobacillus milosensis]|uniref:Sporulation integral membrane protein YtvI n=1 Tax=Filobacillus milosensis TaxID=94137 RepID=A0A4Y8IX81_9BACI|nr:sporulation integral membrane protein YtvI [Filobacillus milosensis]TFB25025.1 sporulation integral membrane protein YtvI [Filobacillus milosensis]